MRCRQAGPSPLDHSWITHSRHRTALGDHQRTPAWSISYSRGRLGSLLDTGGHASDTVRDREAPGSNPGPPTNFEFRIGDFDDCSDPPGHSRGTDSLETAQLTASGKKQSLALAIDDRNVDGGSQPS